ncbi:destruxin synthetase [Cordyceps fumosorosea ARSEF 2679]|uniref:Destruxin synthetase n=1 Tax=Cordyceps fumosorosea (strain ARSEF 2679) TaxID=1081104 RepID=A0A168DCN4_CORFA|nr:destruxin synthetase [Cordyceps fumosorosea ARSEF 2679]OAA72443.1 destruxin synthetase [Cordyceps fumosorosea ARSEF 2679]
MAVCAWDGDLTYAMLDQLSTVLAARLTRHGVGSDVRVPLCFHKSKWTPVAILAILKAGGAFVLLDPSLPEQRLRSIVQQLDVKFILASVSNKALSSRLVSEHSSVLVVDDDVVSESETGDNLQGRKIHPGSTCYVVFTSGSTGTPKGIMITHENAASAMHHHVPRLELTAETRMFDFASYSTDVSISNLFLVWAAGGCLCVPKESDRNNNPEQSIVDLRANTIDITPSLARLMSPASIPEVKLIIFGGEALRVGDVERWWGKTRIIHEYGSSECTQNSTMNCRATCPEDVVRIGTGAGMVTWVVDPEDHNILVPPGEIGELLLEGPLVGRGYMHDPDKTAAAFIEAPVWLQRGGPGCSGRQGRLYKSGDLVRYNKDGSLTFVDRKDGQAKVRGQRVDLGEVEHWVRACIPGTTEVAAEVVLLPGVDCACSTLLVFLQANESLADLCQFRTGAPEIVRLPAGVEDKLAQHLPSYMIPSALVLMDELPKTATGKMHRSRLREAGSALSAQQLAEARTSEASSKQQPTSPVESLLQGIWARVLGLTLSNIGLDDSFFHLGGDSIAAMRVVAESRTAGLYIAVADILRHRRLRPVAATAIPLAETIGSEIPVRRDSGPVQQSLYQERLWLVEQSCPGQICYLKPCAIRLRGPLQLPALNTALNALEKRHESLRTTFATHGQVHLQQVQPFQPKELAVIEFSSEADGPDSLRDVLEKDHTTGFRLELSAWRASLYRCGFDDHVLSIVLHNIIVDGWSLAVLSRELTACYSAAVYHRDPLSQLEPLPIQYSDYAAWQRQQVQTDEHQRQLEYWARRLDSSVPAELRLDKPRPAVPSCRAEIEGFKIDDALYDHLQLFCKEREVTLPIVMLSALAATHYRLTGVGDATIGSVCSSRDRVELKNLIGSLVNLYPLRIKVENETFGSLVQQVQETTTAAFANQDVTWGEIAAKLEQGKPTPLPPLFRMVFTFNNTDDLPDFTFEGVDSQVLDTLVTEREDIEFVINQKGHTLQGQVFYSTDVYERESIGNMTGVFQDVLERGLSNAEQTFSAAAVFSDLGDA